MFEQEPEEEIENTVENKVENIEIIEGQGRDDDIEILKSSHEGEETVDEIEKLDIDRYKKLGYIHICTRMYLEAKLCSKMEDVLSAVIVGLATAAAEFLPSPPSGISLDDGWEYGGLKSGPSATDWMGR